MNLISIILAAVLAAGPQVIVPKPVETNVSEGCYVYGNNSKVNVKVGDFRFKKELSSKKLPAYAVDAAYRLSVSKKGVEIVSATELGAFYASKSLEQMLAVSDTLQFCIITDYPRFRHRGLMMDISRNFRDKDFIIKQLDAMALLKMNSLHLHLTDCAGWRIQIDKYPLLTQKGAWRIGNNFHEWNANGRKYSNEGDFDARGGYLTKDDAREIVAYAAKLNINVIPEIEIPAHSGEVVAAYPHLACPSEKDENGHLKRFISECCPGNPETLSFFEDVLDEVIEIFPSEFIHIGGDEANRSIWKDCPVCQDVISKEGLKDEAELQAWLTRKLEQYLVSKGRRLVGWDEIVEGGLAPEATVMAWRDAEIGYKATGQGHDVILSPTKQCYLDYPQDAPMFIPAAFGVYQPLERVYDWNPVDGAPSQEAIDHILGVQGNLWTEYVPTEEHFEYMIYPRSFALAEVGWTPQSIKDYPDFRERAITLSKTFAKRGYNTFDIEKEVGHRPEFLKEVEHLGRGKKVTYAEDCKWSSKYCAAKETTFTDGLRGDWGYNDPRWQGLLCDIDVTIDLEEVKDIHYVGASFMAQLSAGVGFPVRVEVYVSENGTDFTKAASILDEVPPAEQQTMTFTTFGSVMNEKARYVRFVAKRRGEKNFDFLFTDEIIIN